MRNVLLGAVSRAHHALACSYQL